MKEVKSKSVFSFGGTDLVVRISEYQSGRKAIQLFDSFSGEPYLFPTADLQGLQIKFENEVLVKDYSENEGMFEFLTENNVITWTGKTVVSGFVELYICFVNPQEVWKTDENFVTF